ncbi:MAG: hypothetical protein ACFFKA_18910 [Candidatus Thorarchaeota archaeon]
MNNIFKQKNTFVYLAVSIILIIAALIIGIDDNPPGIIVFFLGSIALILVFTHNWKKAKPYLFLMLFSLLGFIISAILVNVFETAGGEGTFLGIFTAMFFIITLFISPAGLIVGIVGSIVYTLKKKERVSPV